MPSTARIWLEYARGWPASAWSTTEWKILAAALATVQAGCVADSSLLSEAWLNHDDLRRWVELDRSQFLPLRLTKGLRRLAGAWLEPEELSAVSALARKRNKLLDRLDSLPTTLCHNDIWSGNALLEKGRGGGGNLRPIIFDWQLVGPGPIGSDLPFAIVASVWLMFSSGRRIGQLERALLSGYLAGLRRAGRIDLLPAARESFALTAALRYSLMLPQLLRDIIEPNRMSEVIVRTDAQPAHVLANRAQLIKAGVRWSSAFR